VAIHTDNAVRDFYTESKVDTLHNDANGDSHSKRHRRDSITITIDENGSTIPEGRHVDADKAYVFVPKALPATMESKYPNLQVSYSRTDNPHS
jgi:hypothetical protein